jgi:hypothetical protein
VGGGGEAGKGRELKIMALLLPQDLQGLVSQAQEQVAAADEQAAQLAAAAEPPPLAEQQPALFPVEAERLQGDYQWAKEYGYDLNRESVHYAVRLGKGAALYYRMQVRAWGGCLGGLEGGVECGRQLGGVRSWACVYGGEDFARGVCVCGGGA